MSHAAPPSVGRPRPLVLCVLDGFGEQTGADGNAGVLARMPRLAEIARSSPRTTLAASGADVGLHEGALGCSATGHLGLGAGRIPRTERVRIDEALALEKLATNEVLAHTFTIAKEILNSRLHLFCLVSTADVHASRAHLHEVIRMARFFEVQVVLHAFLDGRHASAEAAWELLAPVEETLRGTGVIGTLSGRHFAMDRSGRWDRTWTTYQAIVRGQANHATTAFDALQEGHAMGITEDWLPPVRIGEYEGMVGTFMADFASNVPSWKWFGEEVGLSLNVRADRMRQLSAMFVRHDLPAEVTEWLSDRGKAVHAFQEHCYRTLVEHDPAMGLPVAFPREVVSDSFGEVIASAGFTQLRCAESEKEPHVTWMFSGGHAAPFTGEERRIVPSPRDVERYAERPEMSAAKVAEEAAAAVTGGAFDFILVNFANVDALAHAQNVEAAGRGLAAVDAGIGVIADAVRAAGGALVITAAHGSGAQTAQPAENQEGLHGELARAPVPFYYVNEADAAVSLRSGGRLEDVAPTLLEILGLPQPAGMTGRSLRAPA